MQDVDRVLEPDCVDRPIRIAAQVFDDFQDPWTDTLPGLRGRMPSAELRHPQCPTNLFNGSFWKREQIALCRSDPKQRFLVGSGKPPHEHYPYFGMAMPVE